MHFILFSTVNLLLMTFYISRYCEIRGIWFSARFIIGIKPYTNFNRLCLKNVLFFRYRKQKIFYFKLFFQK